MKVVEVWRRDERKGEERRGNVRDDWWGEESSVSYSYCCEQANFALGQRAEKDE